FLEHGHHIERSVREQYCRTGGRALVASHRHLDLVAAQRDDRGDSIERRAQGIRGRTEQQYGVARDVFRDDMIVAAVNDAARRRQRHLPQPVLLRLERVAGILEDLCAEKGREQQHEQDDESPRRHARTACEVVGMKAHVGDARRMGRSSISVSRPKIAVTTPLSGDQTSISMNSSPTPRRCSASRKMMSKAHLPRKKKKAFNRMSSAKNTALSQDALKPTRVMPSAPAPNACSSSESDTMPMHSPITAALPGRTRIDTSSSSMMRKSGDTRQPSSGRSV